MRRAPLGVLAAVHVVLPALIPTAPGAASLVTRRAQPEAEVRTPLAEHPIVGMIGVWRGTISRKGRVDGQWREAVASKRARWNLAGSAIIVEDYAYQEDADSGGRRVQVDDSGFIEWDEMTGRPVLHSNLVGGEFERFGIELSGDGGQIRWSMKPNTELTWRFTITLGDSHWHEVGEVSRDEGETWTQILEIDLHRVQED